MGEKLQLYIRTDMNSTIATGHMTRCIAIAKIAKERGIGIVFITADVNAKELLAKLEFENIILNSEWNNLDGELELMLDIIKKNNIKLLLMDSYQVTKKYMEELSKYVFTIYIDDLNRFIYPVNILICYANYYENFGYERNYIEYSKKTQFLLGCKYVPIRDEFKNLPTRIIKNEIENVLVMSGGADTYNSLDLISELLLKYNFKNIKVLCGPYIQNVEELKRKYAQYNVEICINVANVVDYMLESDLAISAGGTTLYELCACGTPTITYSFADNQLENVLKFDMDGIMDYIGDIRKNNIKEALKNSIEYYMDYNCRLEKSVKMKHLVDGNGAERIVDKIERAFINSERE